MDLGEIIVSEKKEDRSISIVPFPNKFATKMQKLETKITNICGPTNFCSFVFGSF